MRHERLADIACDIHTNGRPVLMRFIVLHGTDTMAYTRGGLVLLNCCYIVDSRLLSLVSQVLCTKVRS